ncbi:hypothetical protein CRUP_013906 [Coryphaenoides rupestris]|nr:hypothetical protein CRUP_013906 [Coryphaenoides rupestris]
MLTPSFIPPIPIIIIIFLLNFNKNRKWTGTVLRCQTAWASRAQSSGGKSSSSRSARPGSSRTTMTHFHQ